MVSSNGDLIDVDYVTHLICLLSGCALHEPLFLEAVMRVRSVYADDHETADETSMGLRRVRDRLAITQIGVLRCDDFEIRDCDRLAEFVNETKKLLLENDLLQVQILPAFGGKITSLRSVRTGEEFLLPPLQGYRHVSVSASFSESDGGGFDECLPSVATCDSIADEPPVPDHGDLWRSTWNVVSKGDAIVLHCDAVSRPLRLTRRAILDGSSLILEYDLVNLSERPATWLWSAHPLLKVDSGDRIVLPHEIENLTVSYSANDLLEKASSVPWPLAQSTSGCSLDLSKMSDRDGTTAHKLFARMGKSGWAALYRRRIGQGLVMRFDPSVLPYLGLWICSGAWPASGAEKQYTVALEPTTCNMDSLASACLNKTIRSLNAREHFRWKLQIQLAGASRPLNYQDFCTTATIAARP